MPEEMKNRIGAYQRLQLLGAGGQGRVFKAVCVEDGVAHVARGDAVAIKILQRAASDDAAVERQQRHSRALQTLDHRHIVRYLDCFFRQEGEWDEALCLVMELLDGDDLKSILKEHPGGLPWDTAKAILEQCLEGLMYARNKGVYHRDLKPSNILVTTDGMVKLIDFGIAHIDEGGTTTTGDFKGTFDYMAPDFVRVQHLKDYEPCDIFSLGVCFYQALTGKLPFPEFTGNPSIAYVTRWQDPKSLDVSFRAKVFRVYPQARAFIQKCLAVERDKRFQSFADMLKALRGIRPRTIRHQGGETYECEEWVGRGGFGEVFRARRVRDGRKVAIKYLASAQHSPHRFIKEARLIKEFRHSHIVEYVDFLQMERSDGTSSYYLILEFLEGMPKSSLRGRLKQEPQGLSPDEVLVLFDGYLDALHYLHTGNKRDVIIHRDIKPSNLYAPDGAPDRAKVFDLGVARDVKGTATAGVIPGTLDYMPPEFATGDDRGTPQSDLYSLGLCFYEALTGKPVFPPLPRADKEAWPQFMSRARTSPQLDFSASAFQQCPVLVDIVRKVLEPKPRRRFASAKDMRIEFRRAWEFLHPPEAEPEPEPERVPKARDGTKAPPLHTRGTLETDAPTGGAANATGGADPTKVPPTAGATHAPSTQAGTEGGTLATGASTAGGTPGTRSGGRLQRRFADYKARRARRRVLIGLAVVVLAAIGGTWGVLVLPGLIRERQVQAIRVFLEKEAQATTEYVENLARCNIRLDEQLRKSPNAPEWSDLQSEMAARIQALPGLFSNQFLAATHDLKSMEKIRSGWSESAFSLGQKEDFKALDKWMKAQIQERETSDYKLDFKKTVDSFKRRIPGSITPKNIQDVEGLLKEIEDNKQKIWAYVSNADRNKALDELSGSIQTNMIGYLKDLATSAKSVDTDYEQLQNLQTNYPGLVGLVSAQYEKELEEAEKALNTRTIQDQIKDFIATAEVASTTNEFADLNRDYSQFLENPDYNKRTNEMYQAVLISFREAVKKAASETQHAYSVSGMQIGDKDFQHLTDLLESAPLWARDGEVKEQERIAQNAQSNAQSNIQAQQREENQQIQEAANKYDELAVKLHRSIDLTDVTQTVQNIAAHQAAVESYAGQPEVQKAYSYAIQASVDALLGHIGKETPANTRADRIKALDELLQEPAVTNMLAEKWATVREALEKEQALFILVVENGSSQTVKITVGEGREAIQTNLHSSATGILRLEGVNRGIRTDFQCTPVKKGYEPISGTFTRVGGGGLQTNVPRFDLKCIPIQVSMEKMTPPITVEYRAGARLKWNEWPEKGKSLQPGTYEFRLSRADYETMVITQQVKRGAADMMVEPVEKKWNPTDRLKTLQLPGLSETTNMNELAELLNNNRPIFEWPDYQKEYDDLRSNLITRYQVQLNPMLETADEQVRAYCASRYQITDPAKIFSSDDIEYPKLEFPDKIPVVELNKDLQQQVQRLSAWKSGETTAANQLSALSSRLSDPWAARCRLESALLNWEGVLSPPEDQALQKEPEYWRWRAHAQYKGAGEPSAQREVLTELSRYVEQGGVPDLYDLQLATYTAALCWDKYIQSVQEPSNIRNDTKIENPKQNRKEELKGNHGPAQDVRNNLNTVLKKGGSEAKGALLEYIQDRLDREDPHAQLAARYLATHAAEFTLSLPEKTAWEKLATKKYETLQELLDF